MNDSTTSTDSTTPTSRAPETYEFRAPEGHELDKALVDKATPIFKELGLDQASAQKLVDFAHDQAKSSADLAVEAVKQMREGWRGDFMKSDLGGKLDSVRADIGRMKDAIFKDDATGRKAFEDAMDLTGAGDHPAIIKAIWKASEAYREGAHVSGGGPSTHGQSPPNTPRPSAAQAMYPNLPSSNAA